MKKKKLTLPQIEEIFRRLQALSPQPVTELQYANLYTLLVAVVLSAQATDRGVNKATDALFKIADTPQKMLDLGYEELRQYIKTINFYTTKAKNIISLSQSLVTHFEGEVPPSLEQLQSLAGVGRKTANVILNVGFGMPTIAVDTHIVRVSYRVGLTQSTTPVKVEKDLERFIPDQYKKHAHHWLILHGRYICKARKPLCQTCPINDICLYEPKNLIM